MNTETDRLTHSNHPRESKTVTKKGGNKKNPNQNNPGVNMNSVTIKIMSVAEYWFDVTEFRLTDFGRERREIVGRRGGDRESEREGSLGTEAGCLAEPRGRIHKRWNNTRDYVHSVLPPEDARVSGRANTRCWVCGPGVLWANHQLWQRSSTLSSLLLSSATYPCRHRRRRREGWAWTRGCCGRLARSPPSL